MLFPKHIQSVALSSYTQKGKLHICILCDQCYMFCICFYYSHSTTHYASTLPLIRSLKQSICILLAIFRIIHPLWLGSKTDSMQILRYKVMVHSSFSLTGFFSFLLFKVCSDYHVFTKKMRCCYKGCSRSDLSPQHNKEQFCCLTVYKYI